MSITYQEIVAKIILKFPEMHKKRVFEANEFMWPWGRPQPNIKWDLCFESAHPIDDGRDIVRLIFYFITIRTDKESSIKPWSRIPELPSFKPRSAQFLSLAFFDNLAQGTI